MSKSESGQNQEKINCTLRLVRLLDRMSRTRSGKAVAEVLSENLGIETVEQSRRYLYAFAKFSRMVDAAESESRRYFDEDWDMLGPHFVGVRTCFDPTTPHLS
jgi:hypothetical protein